MNRFFLGNDVDAPPHIGRYSIPDNIKRNIAVDIGSCVGGFLSATVDRDIIFDEMFCFEASYENFLVLQRNIVRLDPDGCVAFNLAAGKEDGKLVRLRQWRNAGVGNNSLLDHEDWVGGKYHNVMTISYGGLFRFLGVEHINYLKIDCEGSEYDFLMGQDLSRVDSMGIEIHNQLGEDKMSEMLEYIKESHQIVDIQNAIPDVRHYELTTISKSL